MNDVAQDFAGHGEVEFPSISIANHVNVDSILGLIVSIVASFEYNKNLTDSDSVFCLSTDDQKFPDGAFSDTSEW